MKYIIESCDGFRRLFPHAYKITLDDGWFCITDENNISWEFNIRYHTINRIYEKGDWEFITNEMDKHLVQKGIELLKKEHPHTTFEIPYIKKYDGVGWFTTVYEVESTTFHIIIL